MVLLSIFFTRIRSTEDHQQIVLYSFCRSTLALHLAVKILLQIFLYEDLSTLALHTSVSCIYQKIQRIHFVVITLLNSHFYIYFNHQQNTRRSDQIETIKTIMQTTRPRITWKGFTNGSVYAFLKIFDQVRKDLDCELFYSELKRHNVSHYIYYLATDNIHRVERR